MQPERPPTNEARIETAPSAACDTKPAPLLTIAIPTFNRAALLAELLGVLAPQLAGHPEVELLICDNASTDATPSIIERFRTPAMRCHRQPENIGSDANFVSAFHLASGKYFWLLSDDDIPVPDAISDILSHLAREEFDLIYLTSYGYRTDWRAERQTDSLHRRFHRIASPLHFARVVNVMFTFISGIITNKSRLLDLQAGPMNVEDPSAFLGTNLTQLSWTLPLLRSHRQSLVLWDRPLAARLGHSGGYELAQVFGENLAALTRRCLPDRPDIAKTITDVALRRWFPSIIREIRVSENQHLALGRTHGIMRRVFGRNFRYWLFTYPVLKMPLPLSGIWLSLGTVVSRLIYLATVPGFWRKQT